MLLFHQSQLENKSFLNDFLPYSCLKFVFRFLIPILLLLSLSANLSAQDVCVGSTLNLTNPIPGGNWSSSNNSIATVNNSGIVTGVLAGNCLIFYVDPSSNWTTYTVEVNELILDPIVGQDTLCLYGTTMLSNSNENGSWSSSNNTIASVNSLGEVNGVSTGSCTITYTVSEGGCTESVTIVVVVVQPVSPTITLSSAPGTNHQILNVDYISNDTLYYLPLDTIKYTIGGSATGAYLASGQNSLPNGVVGWFSNGVYYIAGTPFLVYPPIPTTPTIYSYIVRTTGTDSLTVFCPGNGYPFIDIMDDITLNPPCVHSISGPSDFYACENYYFSETFVIEDNPTNVTVTGLPPGLSYNYLGGNLEISGYPFYVGYYSFLIYVSGGNCIPASFSGNIFIDSSPELYLSSATNSQNQTVCAGSPIDPIMYSQIFFGSPFVQVNGLPDGVSGYFNGYEMIISGSPTESGTFTYVVTSSSPCGYYTYSGTISVDLPVILPPITGPDVVCVGDIITLYQSVNGGVWPSSNTTVAVVDQNGVVSGHSDGTTTITYTKNQGQCTASVEYEVAVGSSSTIQLTSNVGSDYPRICIGSTITDIIYTTGGSASNASISSGSLPIGITGTFSGNLFVISGVPEESGVFQYSVTTSGSACASEQSLNGVITVNEMPIISPWTDELILCEGEQFNYSVTPTGGYWSTSDVSIVTIDQSGNGTANTEGIAYINYTVTVGACTAEANGLVTVLALPSAHFNFVDYGSTIDFTNNSSNGIYFWEFGNGTVSNETNPSIVYGSSGIYYATLNVQNQCGSDTFTEIIEILSREEIDFSNFEVYPNPFNDFVNIHLKNAENTIVELYSLSGELIEQFKMDNSLIKLDLRSLSAGTYIIKITRDNESNLSRIIKR